MTTNRIPDPADPKWYDNVRAAEYLGLKPMTLHNYRHHDTGPKCTRLRHRCYYHLDDLEAFDNARKAKTQKRDERKAAKAAKAAKPKSGKRKPSSGETRIAA
jgi:hypothetical protein